jgi:DHA3 family tetracycline resistance protein-like MFS transporter
MKTLKLRPETAYLVLTGGRALCLSTIFTANMIYQISRVGLSPLQLVLVGTTLELSVLLFEVPTGVVADVYSRRLSILIGLALMGLGFVVEGSLPVFAAVLLGQFLWGVGHTFTSGATQAWIVDEVGEENAGRAFFRGSQAGNVCGLAGIGLGVALGSPAINLPVVAGGLALIGLAILLSLVMPETRFVARVARADASLRASLDAMWGTLRDGLRLVRTHPAMLTIFGVGLFYGLYSEGYDRLSAAHLMRDTTLPTVADLQPVVWFGAIQAAGHVLGLLATEWVRRRVDATRAAHVTRALFSLSLALTGMLAGFAITGSFGAAFVLMVLIHALRDLIGPLYDTWMNQRIDSRVRATVISMSGQVDAVGQIAGGPGVGWIGSASGLRAALLTSTVLLSPVLVLIARAHGNRRASQAAGPAPVPVESIEA